MGLPSEFENKLKGEQRSGSLSDDWWAQSMLSFPVILSGDALALAGRKAGEWKLLGKGGSWPPTGRFPENDVSQQERINKGSSPADPGSFVVNLDSEARASAASSGASAARYGRAVAVSRSCEAGVSITGPQLFENYLLIKGKQ